MNTMQAPDQGKRERMFEAEIIHQQLEQLQQYFSKLEKQTAEVLSLKTALGEFQTIKEGEEMLVPVASGIFMKAIATSDKELRVNVGQGVVVPKSVDDVHVMLDEQLRQMRTYEDDLHKQFDDLLGKLRIIEQEFSESSK